MTTTYWKGTGTQSAPASGNWDITQGSDWSTGQTPNGEYQGPPVDTVFNNGTYVVTLDDDQFNQALNTYYNFVYPYEVASITTQTGARVTFQSASGQVSAGLQSDGALNNHGSVTFNIGGSGVSASSTVNTGNLTVAGGVFANNGTFTNGGTTTISGGSFTSGTFSNGGTMTVSGGSFTNSGTFTNGGTTTISSGSFTDYGTFVNSKTLNINGAATTIINSITNTGTISINSNTTLQTNSDITNTGTISVSGTLLDSGVLQGGGGTLNMMGGVFSLIDNTSNIVGYGTVQTEFNDQSGVIDANMAGLSLDISDGSGPDEFFINRGLLEATGNGQGAGGTMVLDGLIDASYDVTGTIAAYSSGTIAINADATVNGGTLLASNGTIRVAGILAGSKLQTAGTGVFVATGGTLDGTSGAVVNQGSITLSEIGSGASASANTLTLKGTLTNSGTITLNGPDAQVSLLIGAATTLQGGGTISMTYGASNSLGATTAKTTLTNVDNTISGAGQITGVAFTNDAAGTINANNSSGALKIATGNTVVNAGLMEATEDESEEGGTLVIADAVQNAGGTIAAYLDGYLDITGTVTGGTVQCSEAGDVFITGTVSGASIVQTGGVLLIDGIVQGGTLSGGIDAVGGSLDGTSSAVANQGTVSVTETVSYVGGSPVYSPASLTLKGTISNTGTINVSGPDAQVSLLAGSPMTTLQGGGQVILSDGGANAIDATATGDQLVNVDNTISGNGALGLGNLVLNNEATVNATGGSPLVVELSAKTASTNTGTMEATGGGELQFVKGLFTNTGTIDADGTSDVEFANTATITNGATGAIEATNGGAVYIDAVTRHPAFFTNQGVINAGAGSAVTIGLGATTNDVGGTLTGGTWEAAAGGMLSLAGPVITTDAATIVLSGTGASLLSSTGTTLQQSLTTIAAGGVLHISGFAYTTANAITLNGTLNLTPFLGPYNSSSTFTSGLITASAGSLIQGGSGGTIASSLNDAGTINSGSLGGLTFSGANDTFSGAFNGGGTGAAINFLSGTDTLASSVTFASNLSVSINGATVRTNGSLTDTGNFSMSSGTLSLTNTANTFTVSGTSTSSLTGGTVLGPGTLAFAAGTTTSLSNVTLSGASLASAGLLTLNGTLTLGGASGATDAITNQSRGTFALADGAAITVASGVTGTFSNNWTLWKAAGTGRSTVGVAVNNKGTILAASGTLEFTAAVTGTGSMAIKGGTLQLDAVPASGQTVTFQTTGTLALKANGTYQDSIASFSGSDTIDLLTLANGTVKSFTEASNGQSGILVIGNGTQTTSLTLAGSYTAANFTTATDAGKAGTAIHFQASPATVKKAVSAAATAAKPVAMTTPAFAFVPTDPSSLDTPRVDPASFAPDRSLSDLVRTLYDGGHDHSAASLPTAPMVASMPSLLSGYDDHGFGAKTHQSFS